VGIWLSAIGLFLVFEGLLPAINPDLYKLCVQKISNLPGDQLRLAGLSSMIVGVLIITFVR